MSVPDLTTFKALSFDCYGTLIDWEGGFASDLQPLLSQLPASHPYASEPLRAVRRFNDFSRELEEQQPALLYDANLIASYRALAAELGVAPLLPSDCGGEDEDEDVVLRRKIGRAPGTWTPFPDTVDALTRLGGRYRLVLLSNVDNENIARTVREQFGGGEVRIDAVYTAEDVGSYKPDLRNFEYLVRHVRTDLGVDAEKGELLHVAVSLAYDHAPCKEMGIRSVFIARGGGGKGSLRCAGDEQDMVESGKVAFEWRYETLGEFADEVERQFAEKERQEEEQK